MAKIEELYQEKAKAAASIKDMAARQESWTAEDRSAWDKVNADYDAASKLIEEENNRLHSNEEVQKRLAEVEAELKATHRASVDADVRRAANPEVAVANDDEQRTLAFQAWAMKGKCLTKRHLDACERLGVDARSEDIELGGSYSKRYGDPAWLCGGVQARREMRAGMDVATSGAGKETIPQGFMYELEKKTLEYGHVRQVCRVVSTPTGNTMPWPVVDDTGNVAAILAEATTISTSVDPTFSAITFLSYKLSSKPVFASSEIIQDSAFNLAAEIGGLLGERFGRGENVYFTTGTNSGQPQGVVTAAGTGVTSASATAITADEVLGLVHSLDPSYRALGSVGFMMHDTAILYLRKLKDANGAYLWQPGLQSGVPDRIAGYPVAINQQMEPLVSNLPVTAKKHILFGAFEKFVIRDCGGVRMKHLQERYADLDQECFVAFKRVDARALNTAAFKVLLQA